MRPQYSVRFKRVSEGRLVARVRVEGSGRAMRAPRGGPPRHGHTAGQVRESTTLGAAAAGLAEAEAGSAGGGTWLEAARGATTPIEMMYLSASSTLMSSSCTRDLGSITT